MTSFREMLSRSSSRTASRPLSRADQQSSSFVAKQCFRMRVNVSSLSPAHFDEYVTRFTPEDEGQLFLPPLAARPTSTAANFASRPHTVVASLREDLSPRAVAAPASPSVAHDDKDGHSVLSRLLDDRGGRPPKPQAVSTKGFEFPSLTRIDVLGRRRGTRSRAASPAHQLERCQTPLGLQMMASRIATPAVGVTRVSSTSL